MLLFINIMDESHKVLLEAWDAGVLVYPPHFLTGLWY